MTLSNPLSHRPAIHHERPSRLVDSILPAIQDVDASLPPDEQLARAVETNVRRNVRQIRETPEGQARLYAGIFKLVGAIYDIASGRVRILEST